MTARNDTITIVLSAEERFMLYPWIDATRLSPDKYTQKAAMMLDEKMCQALDAQDTPDCYTTVELSQAYLSEPEHTEMTGKDLPYAVVTYYEGVAKLQGLFITKHDASEFIASKQYDGELP